MFVFCYYICNIVFILWGNNFSVIKIGGIMRLYEYQHIQTGEIKRLNATVYLGEIILYDENWWYGGSITYKFSEWKRIEY